MNATDTRLASHRLICWIYPSRVEGVLFRFAGWAYKRHESGVWGWLGNRADDAQARICRCRAWWRWRRDGRR